MPLLPFGAAPLPGQAGNSGKFLTTNGSKASWATAAGTTNNFNTLSYAQKNLTGSGLSALTGSVNGSNTTFTVPASVYIAHTLEVWLNGVLQVPGDAITETTPASGIFDFVTAPVTNDQIYVVYQASTITNSTYLIAANNLSDVVSQSSSRTNLGLGTIATLAAPSGTVVGTSDTQTLTNKRITKRVLALSANSATPAINTDSYDVVHITSQTAAINTFTTNLSGTPVDGDTLRISITGTGAVSLTWGASFESSTVTLPTTTVTTTRLDVGFIWNTETSAWRCVASA